jgi:hypothetical protein
MQTDTPKEEGEILSVHIGKEIEWLGVRKKDKELVQHHACCFGINHCRYASSHQLYVVDVVLKEDQPKDLVPHEAKNTKGGEIKQDNNVRMALKRRRPHYYDKQQKLELVLAAEKLFESGEHDLISTSSDEEDKCGIDTRKNDIWKDVTCMNLLRERILPNTVDPMESKRARKKILNYHLQDQSFYFKRLFMPRPEDHMCCNPTLRKV